MQTQALCLVLAFYRARFLCAVIRMATRSGFSRRGKGVVDHKWIRKRTRKMMVYELFMLHCSSTCDGPTPGCPEPCRADCKDPVSRGPQGESLHIVTFDLITGGRQNVNRAFEAIFSYGRSDLTRGHFLQPGEGIRVFPHEKNQSSCLRPRRLNMDFTKSIEHHP